MAGEAMGRHRWQRIHWPLDHHDAECETCHVDNDFNNFTCYGCHEHSRSNIRGEHFEEGIFDYENCVERHRSGDEDEAEWRWRSRREAAYPDSRERNNGESDRRFRQWRDDDDDDES
ncbi:MAG: hypothetical protein ABW127_12790 [Candidatus Thiodiazotropha endolucinida]